MFGKKTNTQFKSLDSTRSVVYDFYFRAPYITYRSSEYRLYPKLDESIFIPELNMYLEKLLSGQVDDGNGDLLDNIIFSKAREAMPDLARQHVDHADMLRRLIAHRKADCHDFSQITEERKKELEELEAAYARTRDIIEEG
ncbi:MAG: hypothetical protein LUJ09_09095 [Firmicutes bacterium]|nr:hypothetical protein [Bacillota bacterium]